MSIQIFDEPDLEGIKHSLQAIKSNINCEEAEDVAKVFFGTQPGDFIHYLDDGRDTLQTSMDTLSGLNSNFAFQDFKKRVGARILRP